MVSRVALQRLQEALQELERDVDVRQRELTELKQRVGNLREMVAYFATVVDDSEGPRSRDQLQPKSARNMLVDILRDEGGPLHSRELLERLRERGIAVGGRDPANSVRAYLSHDDRFVSIGMGRWDLASRVSADHPATSRPPLMLALDRSSMLAGVMVGVGTPSHDDSTAEEAQGEMMKGG